MVSIIENWSKMIKARIGRQHRRRGGGGVLFTLVLKLSASLFRISKRNFDEIILKLKM